MAAPRDGSAAALTARKISRANTIIKASRK
jgi:hypothetical protein